MHYAEIIHEIGHKNTSPIIYVGVAISPELAKILPIECVPFSKKPCMVIGLHVL